MKQIKLMPFELKGVLEESKNNIKLKSIFFTPALKARVDRLILEQNSINRLKEFNLNPRCKCLLIGNPGTGKTMTASAVGNALNLPIFTIQLDRIFSKYMGETAAKLRLIFDRMEEVRGVYFFDEIDSIGGSRDLGNDVGEVRIILNTLLQFIEKASSNSIILAATNHPELLDKALFRRFDDVLEYTCPTPELRLELFKSGLAYPEIKEIITDEIIEKSEGLSFDDITKICIDLKKDIALGINEKLTTSIILSTVKSKKGV